jgi:hypothetical protein
MPFSTTTLSLQWSLLLDIGKAYTAGTARVQVQTDAKSPAFDCQISKISFSLKSVNRYDESLSCVLPTSLPPSSYNLWVCVPGFGCGVAAQPLTVLLGANNVQPTLAGTGGNVLVTISGNGGPLPNRLRLHRDASDRQPASTPLHHPLRPTHSNLPYC